MNADERKMAQGELVTLEKERKKRDLFWKNAKKGFTAFLCGILIVLASVMITLSILGCSADSFIGIETSDEDAAKWVEIEALEGATYRSQTPPFLEDIGMAIEEIQCGTFMVTGMKVLAKEGRSTLDLLMVAENGLIMLESINNPDTFSMEVDITSEGITLSGGGRTLAFEKVAL